jgi:PAS domain S-box-containing protein
MNDKPKQAEPLRREAEARLAANQASDKPPRTTEQLLHELRVHQIELEMQNENLRTSQLALEEARDRYIDLYEFAPVGYLTLTHESRITTINLTGATLLGEERKQLLRRSFARIVAPEDYGRWQHYLQQVIHQSDTQTGEVTLMRKDGSRFEVRLDSRLILTDIAAPLIRITLTDITEQKRLDHVLRDKNFDLASARYVADKANRAKSEFLSSMSHELRSPLNAILGFAQLLESGTPPPTAAQKSRIEQIVQAGWYLLDLINEILDLAMIESGKLSLTAESIPLSVMLLDCQTMVEPQAEKSGIRMSFPPPDMSCLVCADRIRLKQVLINLLSNAIKYNRPQGLVEVTYHTNTAQRIHISVRDSGMGLSAEQIAQLFEPFNRLGQEAGNKEGTGIGLVVCKRLVELMGGEIGVESTIGTGSVFWIALPLGIPAPLVNASKQLFEDAQVAAQVTAQVAAQVTAQVTAQVAAALALVRPDQARRDVLYIEDNPANMLLIEHILDRRADLHLLKATEATSGIAMARIHHPHVILMDINLPGISGIQALQMLREDADMAHIPVLAISANAMPLDIENGLRAGFFSYLTKPIKVNEFLLALDEALQFSALNSPPNHELGAAK